MKFSRPSAHHAGLCMPASSAVSRDLVRGSLAVAALLCVGVCAFAQQADGPASGGPSGVGWSLSPDQQESVSAHGYPDSFTIMSVSGDPEEPGRRYRMETWHYHGDQVAVVFVDGDERGNRALDWPGAEPGPTTEFRPEDFAIGMAVRQVEARVFGAESGPGFGVPEDSSEYYAGSYEALQLGFEDGVLVYVDTSPDLPDDE